MNCLLINQDFTQVKQFYSQNKLQTFLICTLIKVQNRNLPTHFPLPQYLTKSMLTSVQRFLNNDLTNQNSGVSTPVKPAQTEMALGICDYIPSVYFENQFISIYIDANSHKKQTVFENILWNKYYEKTLLKEVHAHFCCVKSLFEKYHNTLLSNSLGVGVQTYHIQNSLELKSKAKGENEAIYLKTPKKVYKLKDKLEFDQYETIKDQIWGSTGIIIEKLSQEGKWRRVIIDYGPYKMQENYDIVLSMNQAISNGHRKSNQKQSGLKVKSQKVSVARQGKTKDKKTHLSKSKAVSDQVKSTSNTVISLSKSHRQVQSDVKAQGSSTVRNRKEKNPENNPKSSTDRLNSKKSHKQQSNKVVFSSKSKLPSHIIGKENSNPSDYGSKISSNSIVPSTFRINPSESETHFPLETVQVNGIQPQVAFNHTAKLSQHLQNIKAEGQSKGILMVNRLENSSHAILKAQEQTLQMLRKTSENTKNNKIMSEIINKKDTVIHKQKMQIEQLTKKYQQRIDELHLKQSSETQSLKDEIASVLKAYSKKYEEEKSRALEYERKYAVTEKELIDLKVENSENLAVRKAQAGEIEQNKQQILTLSNKCQDLDSKYEILVKESNEQEMRQRQEYSILEKKHQEMGIKYSNLQKRLKQVALEQI